MSDHEVEMLVRDAFRSREHLVDAAGERLLPAVRGRAARRRRALPVAGAGLATAAVLCLLAVGMSLPRGLRSAEQPPPSAPLPAASPSGRGPAQAPAGWRLESSLGVEITVPDGWATNDIGCGSTDRPTVVRGQGVVTLCYRPEVPTKEVASIGRTRVPPDGLTGTGVLTSVDGVPAQRAAGRLADGRYAGWVVIASKDVQVEVRTRDEMTTRRILDSVRLVSADHFGCATRTPVDRRPFAGSGRPFVPLDTMEVTVCSYWGWITDGDDRLQASGRLTGLSARRLAVAMNSSAPGGNPDEPADQCRGASPPPPDAVLLFRGAGGETAKVWIIASACTMLGADNGRERVQLSHPLLKLITEPLHSGYQASGSIPR